MSLFIFPSVEWNNPIIILLTQNIAMQILILSTFLSTWICQTKVRLLSAKNSNRKKMGWYDLLLNSLSQEVSQARGSPLDLVSIKYIIKMTVSNKAQMLSSVSQTRNIFVSNPSSRSADPSRLTLNIVKNRDIAKVLTRSKAYHIVEQLMTKRCKWCWLHTKKQARAMKCTL